MKKYILTLIAGLLISVGSPAQIGRAFNNTSRHQQRYNQRNNYQRYYQNNQRNNYQQYNNTERVESSNNTNSTDLTQQQNSNSVTLVVYGTADNKDEAIKSALRSAIEQAFGTFVSASTQIVNDELTKDEIVSVSSGNIEKYDLISSEKLPNGKFSVSVKATVSIGKLVQYAQSKGSSIELAGSSFVMNMKMIALNKKNEKQALEQMFQKMIKMCEWNLFNYNCRSEQPSAYGSEYRIPIIITITPNLNYKRIIDEFLLTLKSLSLTGFEIKKYAESGGYYTENNLPQLYRKKNSITTDNYNDRDRFSLNWRYRSYTEDMTYVFGIKDLHFALRNNITDLLDDNNEPFIKILKDKIFKSSQSFVVEDNMGNKFPSNISCGNEVFKPKQTTKRTRNTSQIPQLDFDFESCFLGLDNIQSSYEWRMDLYYDEDKLTKLTSIKVSPIIP